VKGKVWFVSVLSCALLLAPLCSFAAPGVLLEDDVQDSFNIEQHENGRFSAVAIAQFPENSGGTVQYVLGAYNEAQTPVTVFGVNVTYMPVSASYILEMRTTNAEGAWSNCPEELRALCELTEEDWQQNRIFISIRRETEEKEYIISFIVGSREIFVAIIDAQTEFPFDMGASADTAVACSFEKESLSFKGFSPTKDAGFIYFDLNDQIQTCSPIPTPMPTPEETEPPFPLATFNYSSRPVSEKPRVTEPPVNDGSDVDGGALFRMLPKLLAGGFSCATVFLFAVVLVYRIKKNK